MGILNNRAGREGVVVADCTIMLLLYVLWDWRKRERER